MAVPGHDVGVTAVVLFGAVVSLLGVAVWLGLLIWAAKGDGRVQWEHDRDAGLKPGSTLKWTRMGESVQFESAAGASAGYLARPGESADVHRGVVVIQEWWGLVPHIEDVAERFRALGYVALAPDLYHGKSTVEAEEAHHLMEGLDWGRAAQELAGAVAYLRGVAGVRRVGVVGFCMGGALAVIAAADPGVDAYASFYGFPPPGAAALDRIDAPGLIFFGEHENAFSVPDAQAFAERQRRSGKQAEVVVYPDAGHAFFNDARPEAYQQTAAGDAWGRTVELFDRHLRG